MLKKIIVYLVLSVIIFFTVYKASLAYNVFIENNIPVYDGVTYEKKQIEQFIRFKDNFSLWKRLTEINYQLPLNTVDGGFVSFLILIIYSDYIIITLSCTLVLIIILISTYFHIIHLCM